MGHGLLKCKRKIDKKNLVGKKESKRKRPEKDFLENIKPRKKKDYREWYLNLTKEWLVYFHANENVFPSKSLLQLTGFTAAYY